MKSTLKPFAILFTAASVSALPSCTTEEPVEPPFNGTLESLEANFRTPEWFKDAKFGIFAHWGPQCQPESSDWYARNMYIPNEWQFRRHRELYGDQKEFGFKDIIHIWKAEKWDPEDLAKLFKSMGAKYVVSLANHHDNFDMWDDTEEMPTWTISSRPRELPP